MRSMLILAQGVGYTYAMDLGFVDPGIRANCVLKAWVGKLVIPYLTYILHILYRSIRSMRRMHVLAQGVL